MALDNRASTDVDKFVGHKLKLLRKSVGMTQSDLGEAAGVTFQQIQKYERGVNRIGASRLWEFCKIFRIEPGFFFLGLDKEIMPASRKKIEEEDIAMGVGNDTQSAPNIPNSLSA